MSILMARRDLLIAGAAAAAAPALAGLPGCGGAADDDAYEPWRRWNDRGAGPHGLVHTAVLAANAHNTQPWL
ncbi:MAG TPA: Tat pathway signal protein, partial [Xanthobacteraceae bacterium]|nr:Tat pathway signal protein [Xanthobacteraceae bacterium]